MTDEQTKIIPKVEIALMGGSIGAYPEGSFEKNGKMNPFFNRVKYSQSGKFKMVVHSLKELNDIAETLTGHPVDYKLNPLTRWAKKHLPETTFVSDEDDLPETE